MIITIKGADFSAANIGTLNTVSIRKIIGRGVVHSIPNFVEKGSSVNWTLALGENYEFGSYMITMGGEVVNAVVDGSVMTISIANVTGAISISVATTYVGVEDEPVIPDTPTPDSNAIEFKFNSIVENGVDFSNAGSISNGKIVVTKEGIVDYNGITFSNDKDWTFECIGLPSGGTDLVVISANNNVGGYFQMANPTGLANGTVRFRDANRTMSITWPWTTAYTEPKHFAIVYSSQFKAFKCYVDYQEISGAKFESGSASTFETFTPTKLFGGYINGTGDSAVDYAFAGELYYMRFSNKALTVDELHREQN